MFKQQRQRLCAKLPNRNIQETANIGANNRLTLAHKITLYNSPINLEHPLLFKTKT